MAFFTPHILPDLLEVVRQKIVSGDDKSIRLFAEMVGMAKGAGVNVNNTVNSSNSSTTTTNTVIGPGFDAIVRNLDAKRRADRPVVIIEASSVPQIEPGQ